jgi:hypothetical protein
MLDIQQEVTKWKCVLQFEVPTFQNVFLAIRPFLYQCSDTNLLLQRYHCADIG